MLLKSPVTDVLIALSVLLTLLSSVLMLLKSPVTDVLIALSLFSSWPTLESRLPRELSISSSFGCSARMMAAAILCSIDVKVIKERQDIGYYVNN